MNTIVMGSGGPDSLIAYAWVRWVDGIRAKVGRVDFGQRSSRAEIKALYETIPPTDLTHLPQVYSAGMTLEREDYTIPARNLIVAGVAAMMGYDDIVISIQKDEMEAPDRSLRFMDYAQSALSEAVGAEVKFRTPFAFMDKTEMVDWFLTWEDIEWSVPERKNLLSKTMSCYEPLWTGPGDLWSHCGDCPACIRRFIAFKPFGVDTRWKGEPHKSMTAMEYRRRAKSGYYSEDRNKRILEAL